jgi:hypothetical protein
MFTNAMAVVHLLQTMVDVYLWLNDEIADHELKKRIDARKSARKKYIATENQRVRLEILRELDRNNPKPVKP